MMGNEDGDLSSDEVQRALERADRLESVHKVAVAGGDLGQPRRLLWARPRRVLVGERVDGRAHRELQASSIGRLPYADRLATGHQLSTGTSRQLSLVRRVLNLRPRPAVARGEQLLPRARSVWRHRRRGGCDQSNRALPARSVRVLVGRHVGGRLGLRQRPNRQGAAQHRRHPVLPAP